MSSNRWEDRRAERVRRHGFTLIELMISLAIVGIVAAVATVSQSPTAAAANASIKTTAGEIASALDADFVRVHGYPTTATAFATTHSEVPRFAGTTQLWAVRNVTADQRGAMVEVRDPNDSTIACILGVGTLTSSARQCSASSGSGSAPPLRDAYGTGIATEFRSGSATDRCMDIAGASRSNGARVTIWNCLTSPDYPALQQHFTWTPTGELKVYAGTPDEKCVDVYGRQVDTNGTPVVIWDCTGNSNQKWEPGPNGDDFRVAGTNKCLMEENQGTTPGTGLVIQDCDGTPSQRWAHG